MAAMGRTGMKRMVIKEEGIEIELERETPFYAVGTVSMPSLPHSQPMFHHHQQQQVEMRAPHGEDSVEVKEGSFVTSPMVGTFYASPSPDASSFVKVGDRIEEDTVVCIIEAMKVMNEIKAGIKGQVAEILHSSGDPVEFGTKLFRVI